MSTPVLTTVAKLKTHLGISDNSEDALLTQFLCELDEVVASWTKRRRVAGRNPFESVEATEYYSGDGTPELYLDRRPVTAVASVKVDNEGYFDHGANAFQGAEDTWTLGVDFVPKRVDAVEQNVGLLIALHGLGRLWRGVWPQGTGNIQVVYTAGYATIPRDLELAVHHLATGVRQAAGKGFGRLVQSESIGRYSYTLLSGVISGEPIEIGNARGILARYMEIEL